MHEPQIRKTDDTQDFNLHSSLGFCITKTARLFDRCIEDSLRSTGLTRVNWCILIAIQERGQINPSDIAQQVGIDRTATSRALRQLEEMDAVARRISQADRRVTVVTLTKTGQKLMATHSPACRDMIEMIESRLSDDERHQVRLLLRKLVGKPVVQEEA